MPQIPFYTVDAFTNNAFKGNPASVCIFKYPNEEPSERQKQLLAKEFNISETAFPRPLHNNQNEDAFKTESEFKLQWFTPKNEVPLCGHATLAASHVIFNEIGNQNKEIYFDTLSGRLIVQKTNDGRLQMNFPQYEIVSLESSLGSFDGFRKYESKTTGEVSEKLAKTLVGDHAKIQGLAYALPAKKLIVALDSKTKRDDFMKIKVDSEKLLQLDQTGEHCVGIILTLAPDSGTGFDSKHEIVLRYFAPWNGIPEDPATGSAQSAAGPFWSKVLGKTNYTAYQDFPTRGAELNVELDNTNKRINISGNAITIFSGHFSTDIINQ